VLPPWLGIGLEAKYTYKLTCLLKLEVQDVTDLPVFSPLSLKSSLILTIALETHSGIFNCDREADGDL
jgi:hypothetical protein